jgi:hypothetical protein
MRQPASASQQRPGHVDIVEVGFCGTASASTRDSQSLARYTEASGAIYWRDHNLKFHEYTRTGPTKDVQALLEYIETSGDPIFWGLARGSLTVDKMNNNLSYMRTEAPLLAPIFRSDGQARLLSTLLLTARLRASWTPAS